MTTNEELDQIVDEIPDARQRMPRLWDDWPEQVHALIARIIELNDAGVRNIGERDAQDHVGAKFGIRISDNTLYRYARDRLGRRSWRKP